MMDNVSSADITDAARESFTDTPDPRLREICTALVRHLHAFVEEVRPTQGEWAQGIDFLTRTGKTCEGARQEFILLSDVRGVSMLVDTLNASDRAAVTESTVLGPYYVETPPSAASGSDIAEGTDGGEPLWIDVQVVDGEGSPLPGAIVDIWQCAPDGLYDVQRDLALGEHELRARFTSDSEGRVSCWSSVPVAYQIPADGPVGQLLEAADRHPCRPAHVHFRISAPGHATLVTHLFPAGGDYLDSDAVFGVKPSLMIELPEHPAGEGPGDRVLANPWRSLEFTFALAPA